ncbi:hypothetical protein BB558_000924 [Smittium angustum]|uniref:Brix domain-containing protein n=1 Tax=Smittium angustum TaxID=133377 RepID=A0A2U1JD65_SMIAN|nr:hypothetical protein BB558_000924 [Smittium angustum]
MAKKRTKKRTHKVIENEKIPKSFVVRFGKVGSTVSELVRDIRRVMEPHTASKLRERKTNKLRDYLMVAGQYGVTQFVLFSQSAMGTNMKIATLPRGPTLTFRVKQYALSKDCRALLKNPKSLGSEFKTSPLLILNNFGANEERGVQFKLMTTVFQNMFPSIDPSTMHLADARRVVLLNYNEETENIEFRHYLITVNAVGVTKGIKKLLNQEYTKNDKSGSKKKAELKSFEDIGEYVLNEDYASDSEIEDNGESSVVLPQNYIGRGNRKSEQRSVKLVEIGPRMELELVKVEDGMCEGDVMYHKYIHKTEKEIKEMKLKKQKMLTEKALRKKKQEENVEKKKALKESKKKNKKSASGKEQNDEDSSSEEERDPNSDNEKKNVEKGPNKKQKLNSNTNFKKTEPGNSSKAKTSTFAKKNTRQPARLGFNKKTKPRPRKH